MASPNTNPQEWLKRYIQKHFSNIYRSYVQTTGDGAEAFCILQNRTMFRLFVPRQAPVDARPLCSNVRYLSRKVPNVLGDPQQWWGKANHVWSFEEDCLEHVGLAEKVRVHLHCLEGVYMLVHVKEGRPDELYRVSRIGDQSFSPEVAVWTKMFVAKLWGYKATYDSSEQRLLKRMQKRSASTKS